MKLLIIGILFLANLGSIEPTINLGECSSCQQVSKKGCRAGSCTYTFTCTQADGSKKTVTVASGNDNAAKQLAMNECDD